MLEIKDFADLYCTSIYTIRRRIKNLIPIFKSFNPKKRMRAYNLEQCKVIIKAIGIPPDTKNKEQIRSKFPELFV
jgi:hypothetical protein